MNKRIKKKKAKQALENINKQIKAELSLKDFEETLSIIFETIGKIFGDVAKAFEKLLEVIQIE